MNNPLKKVMLAVLLLTGLTAGAQSQSVVPGSTTAWRDGIFHVDVAGVIGRSNIVLGKPNLEAGQAMPLGNGRLGVAVWSANGLTAQLNRADTLPGRLSPGQVVLPGIVALTRANDYSGRLDLYHGEFQEQGGGMTAVAYVEPDTDALVVDVTGADPDKPQTAQLRLWAPRVPNAAAEGSAGLLSEAWLDDKNPESSGRAFGSLSAITAQGRDVSAAVTDPLTITVSLRPYEDGHFRIVIASPHYDGKENAQTIVRSALSSTPAIAHRTWWRNFWNRAAVIRISSKDGSGEYMENLRNIYLYVAAIEKGVEFPGSQAGVADMVSSARDAHRWDSSAFWHWNLRMQVAANIGAGLAELNAPYFNLYRENLSNIEAWTREHMRGSPGSCVPETMRFNGRGIEYESSWNPVSIGRDCDAEFKPYYNARTLSTGAEVSLWVWQQFLATNDRKFLVDNYPLMTSSARFLLSYQKPGQDGLLHSAPSNAHETQWDVTDPTTDIAASTALYQTTIQAAKLLGKDPDLVQRLQSALSRIPPFPRTQQTGPRTLLSPSADADGANIGLETVWPYEIIGDTSPLFALAKRTYAHRPFSGVADWSFDPIQAARLGLGSDVASNLVKITESSQHSVNGLANWEAEYGEFYVEQVGVVADALQEALVQDYDGLIRIAPAIPPDWDFDGSVYVRGNTKVDVQVRNGALDTVIIEAGATGPLKLRNPWPNDPVDVISGATGTKVANGATGPVITFHAVAGASYLVEKRGDPIENHRFSAVSGSLSNLPKKIGQVQLGIFSDRQ
jgi:alpha-L-fucosidase 2